MGCLDVDLGGQAQGGHRLRPLPRAPRHTVGFVLLLAPTAVPKGSERKRWTHIQEGSPSPLVDSVLVALVAALLLHAVQRGS